MDTIQLWNQIAWRLILNWIVVAVFSVLLHHIQPAPAAMHVLLGALATVLGLLAAGIFAAYSSLSSEDCPTGAMGFYNAIDSVVFACMYLLLYSSFFCLYRLGLPSALGIGMEIILNITLGLTLSAMHFVDVWDRVQNAPEGENDQAPANNGLEDIAADAPNPQS